MKLVSLAMSPEEAKDDAPCAAPDAGDAPKYPYGTCLYLDEDALKKLGIKEMPSVGTEIPVQALAKVTGTSERETQEGTRKTLDLQIVKMGFGSGEDAMTRAARTLYPDKA